MERQLVQALTPSTSGFQILWPQMTYLRLSVARLFMTHSAISLPEVVAVFNSRSVYKNSSISD